MEKEEEVIIVSKQLVKPSSRREKPVERIHLAPWDLKMISMDYIQKGILFHKPASFTISGLLTSFSQALTYFYPLAGRLVTTSHDGGDSISISVDSTDDGAEFVHAAAPNVSVSDILASCYIPLVVHSFFTMKELIDHDGHHRPLLGVQVTELADGVFVGCTLNHSVADGTSFWHFMNVWSCISRTGGVESVGNPPTFERWFHDDDCRGSGPLRLPFKHHHDFIRRVSPPPVRECCFTFSSQNIKMLKTKANEETMTMNKISSLQALLAHAWRSVTRARRLRPDQQTTYKLYAGYRSRLRPPLPQTYFGNLILGVPVTVLAGELEERGLGWTALQLNLAVSEQGEEKAIEFARDWTERPCFVYLDQFKEGDAFTGSSPRFDVYGNDFGWGRPVAVRSGRGSKVSGKMTVYPGAEEGSMALEVCLKEEELGALLEDSEFMHIVSGN